MSKIVFRALRELHLAGGRFEQAKGHLDFDVLPELLAYKSLLVETAKEEWRRRNPEKERLPKGFEEKIRLAFREVREGSSVIPVERIIEVDGKTPLFSDQYVEDEVDEAARIIDATLYAAGRDEPFPSTLPPRVIPMFGDWGRTLHADERIEINGNDSGQCASFDTRIRERILRSATSTYEDKLDAIGEARSVTLKATEGGSFTVTLEDGTAVEGVFSSDQEKTITEALHHHHSVRLRIRGTAEFEPRGRIRKVCRVEQLELRPLGEEPYDAQARPIWQVLEDLGKSVPEKEWDKVPKDAARHLDHYLYGTRREEE